MVQIQYSSDLHINDFPIGTPFESFLTPNAPVLVIAGDICSAWDPLYSYFLHWCSRHWYIVIIITGNHEYFCDDDRKHTFEQTDAHIRQICYRLPNVIFLQSGQSYVLPNTNIRFIGATLWSNIDTSIWDTIKDKKGDFKVIYTQTPNSIRRTHPSDICTLHSMHRAWLSSAIASKKENEILIVLTHHMPTMKLLEDRYQNDPLRSCYASKDDDLLTHDVAVWICGHGHRSTKLKIPYGPYCVMNARGYNRQNELYRISDTYNPRAVLDVKN